MRKITGIMLATMALAGNTRMYEAPKSIREGVTEPIQRTSPKIGRNEKCSCGSGKKNKHCCHK